MRKIFFVLFAGLWLIAGNSCDLEETFLQKPDTSGTVDINAVFSSTKNAEAALFRCYRDALKHGWPGGLGINHGMLGALSGEVSRGSGAWVSTWNMVNAGLLPTTQRACVAGTAGSDNFNQNWECIRACFIVKENIDKVPDMDNLRKEYIKAEATALIAYRYMGMFYRYGGIPIVRKSFQPDDDLNIPRVSLQETLDYTLELLEEAMSLPDSWQDIKDDTGSAGAYVGRLTKGAVLAMKARLLMFAARPLFNSATPHISFPGHENLVCFGTYDPARWQAAIDANEAVLTWAAANGYELIYTAGKGNRNTFEDAAKDYGTATSEPNNREVILAYKVDGVNPIASWYNMSGTAYGTAPRDERLSYGMITNFLEYYRSRDGEDIDWPSALEPEPTYRPFQNYLDNIDKIEARYLMDVTVQTRGSMNNPGSSPWNSGWGWGMTNRVESRDGTTDVFPNAGSRFGMGNGLSTKFHYHAGTRGWFEPPLFRLAETYLNLAEAYNESGNLEKAQENLNMVHHRAGLPTITETDRDALKRLIWREKAVEYFNENHRYFDAKHWKHPDIATNICGGVKREFYFLQKSNSTLVADMWGYWDAIGYTAAWHDRMFLEPFHQDEVNKGVIVQNPGY